MTQPVTSAKEKYQKPQMTIEAAVLARMAGQSGDADDPGPLQVLHPLFGICCD